MIGRGEEHGRRAMPIPDRRLFLRRVLMQGSAALLGGIGYAAGWRARADTPAPGSLDALPLADDAGPVGADRVAWMRDGPNKALRSVADVLQRDRACVLDWEGSDPTGRNDSRAAFQNALDEGIAVYVPPNAVFAIDGGLLLPDHAQLYCDVAAIGAPEAPAVPSVPRLVFTGTSAAAFGNADAANRLLYAGLSGISIHVVGAYSWMFDLTEPINLNMREVRMQTSREGVGGLRSRKLAVSNPSWVNTLDNVQIRLPDASPARVLDIDWSDNGGIRGCSFSGGAGSIITGTGALSIVSNRFDRALGRPDAAALTLAKQTRSATSYMLVGNEFEEYFTGLLLHADLDDALPDQRLMPFIDGNHFRGGAMAVDDIRLVNATGPVSRGPVIGRNVHAALSNPRRLSFDPSRWRMPRPADLVLACNYHAPTTLAGTADETVLASEQIPARHMGPYGRLEIECLWESEGRGGRATLRVKAGGAIISARTLTGERSAQWTSRFQNTGRADRQVGMPSSAAHAELSAEPVLRTEVDTDAAFEVAFTATLAAPRDRVRLLGYLIRLIPG